MGVGCMKTATCDLLLAVTAVVCAALSLYMGWLGLALIDALAAVFWLLAYRYDRTHNHPSGVMEME